jgi:hypothetical protein
VTAGIKANVDGSAAIQVGGVDAITLTSAGAASFVTSPMTIQGGSASAPSLTFSGDTNTGIFSPAADTIAFTEGGVESMRIDSSGNVGIGESSPSAALHIKSATNNIMKLQSSDAATGNLYFSFINSSGTTKGYIGYGNSGDDALQIQNEANSYMTFATNGSERARITSDGYSRWSDTGSYSYTGTAHSINNSASNDIVRFFSSNATPYGVFVKYTAADPNNTTSYVFAAEQNTGVNIYKIWSNGTVTARSDQRFKKNIETTRDGYAEDLAKLRVVKYNWYNHEDDTPKELGLIAQEVEQVFPNLVMTENAGEENEAKSIKTSVLPFMLLKAIQELKAELDATKAEIALLKGAA